MSHVTDIILVTAIEDGAEAIAGHPSADKVSDYLKQNHNGHVLLEVSPVAGGDKAMQCDVFMSAINGLDIPAFVKWFAAIEWEFPEYVQLLLKDENDDRFAVYEPKRGRVG